MLEAKAHNHVKILLNKSYSPWPHNLTLSRLVSRSLRRRDTSLIEIESASQNFWWLGLLIPLCLQNSDAVLLLSKKQRRRLLEFEIPRLKKEGFDLTLWEGDFPPSKGELWLMDDKCLVDAYLNGNLMSRQLIIPEAEHLSRRLAGAMTIKIVPSDWEKLRRANPSANSGLIQVYERISRRLCSKATSIHAEVRIEMSDLLDLKDILGVLSSSPQPWQLLENLSNLEWAIWAKINYKTLDWDCYLRPIYPFKNLKNLFNKNPFLMLTEKGNAKILSSELEASNCEINVNVHLDGIIHQEPIQLFMPGRQPLPNTELYFEHLLIQCRRLIVGQSGITILLLDDWQLRQKITTELAAEFGRRVIHEEIAPQVNGVICCSCSWWLEHQEVLPVPSQLILALLPFASLESPIVAAKVESLKRKGEDWFRNFLLPDLLSILPYLVVPIRGKQARLAILDGRILVRSWGEQILHSLEPWTPVDRLLPS